MKSKWVKNLFKLGLVVGLLYFLLNRGFISLQNTRQAFSNWPDLAMAFSAVVFSFALGIIRWNWLLRAQNISLSFRRVFHLTFIGAFFNIALPGAVSGDFVKAFYVGREIPGQRARAFASILFDRVAGVSALVLVSAIALIWAHAGESAPQLFAPVQFSVILGAMCVLIFYTYLFLVKEQHDVVLIALKKIESKLKKVATVTRIYLGLRHYHSHRITVVKSILISMLIQLATAWSVMKFGRALGVDTVPYLSICVLVPLGLLVTAIPIFPAGVGTGHAAFLYLFHLAGTERGADIFTFSLMGNIAMGAIGGLIYLQFKGHNPALNFSEESQTAQSSL